MVIAFFRKGRRLRLQKYLQNYFWSEMSGTISPFLKLPLKRPLKHKIRIKNILHQIIDHNHILKLFRKHQKKF